MRPHLFALVLFAGIAAIVVLTATQQGVGVSPDSIAYLSTAESIAAGRGVMEVAPGGWRPLTHFPPFYPLLLSAGPVFGAESVPAARAVAIVLLPLFIVIASLLAFHGSGRSLLAAILTAAVLLASRDVVSAWSMAWSEPLFFVLLFACFAVLSRYLAVEDTRMLIIAAVLAAASVLTRYAGISIVATGALAVLAWSGGPALRRARNAAIFTAVAMLPVGVWLVRNTVLSGNATARSLVFHPQPLSAYLAGAENVFRFLMRGWEELGLDRIPRNLQALAGASFVLFFVIAGLRERTRRGVLAPLLALFAIVHLLTFSAVGVFLDAVVFDDRLLLPVTVSGAVLVVVLLVQWTSGERRRTARAVVVCLFALHIIVGARAVASFVAEARREGLGYNSRSWRESPLLVRVAALPARTPLCSNAEDVIWLRTGRSVAALPWKYSPVTTLANPRYGAELKTIPARCGVVVWFSTVGWRAYLPAREELRALPALREVAREDDGSMFARYTGAK